MTETYGSSPCECAQAVLDSDLPAELKKAETQRALGGDVPTPTDTVIAALHEEIDDLLLQFMVLECREFPSERAQAIFIEQSIQRFEADVWPRLRDRWNVQTERQRNVLLHRLLRYELLFSSARFRLPKKRAALQDRLREFRLSGACRPEAIVGANRAIGSAGERSSASEAVNFDGDQSSYKRAEEVYANARQECRALEAERENIIAAIDVLTRDSIDLDRVPEHRARGIMCLAARFPKFPNVQPDLDEVIRHLTNLQFIRSERESALVDARSGLEHARRVQRESHEPARRTNAEETNRALGSLIALLDQSEDLSRRANAGRPVPLESPDFELWDTERRLRLAVSEWQALRERRGWIKGKSQ
jgi:hypothetical protein